MQSRFNSFQRTMLSWNDLHPYSAIHVARVAEPLDLERIHEAINSTLERRGLTGVEIDRRRSSYRYVREAPPCSVEILTPGADPHRELVEFVGEQLNTPFDSSGPFCPIRFFAMPVEDGFWFGLVYFHAVADAVSIVYLLRELVHVYTVRAAPDTDPPNLYPPRFDNLLRHQPRVLARKIMGLPAAIRSARRSCRPRYENPHDATLGYKLLTLQPARLRDLLRTSKAWKVTLNDLFMALLLKVVSGLSGDRADHRRRKLAAGCIVNLRHSHGLEGDDQFGLFLGSFNVSHDVRADTELKSLALAVCEQTRRIKQKRLSLAFPFDLAVARVFHRFLSLERRRKFYQKNRPLWGGITNMNLNSIPTQPGEVPPADYFRAVATGPATPLVLSITTFGEFAHIGISYRTTVYSEPMIGEFQTRFAAEMAKCAIPS